MDLTFGARLRSQRERQQVALAAIAEETKISVALLEGLERDDLSRWPGGLFRRAYVRTYAQKIGLDPEQVVREFIELYPDPVEAASPVEVLAQTAQANGKRPRTRIGFLIAGLAGLRPQRSETRRRVITPETFPLEEHSAVAEDVGAVPEALLPAVGPDPLPDVADSEASSPRLVMIPPPETSVEPRREVRMLERSVASAACLCTRIAAARDESDLAGALEDTVEILDAQGAILWVWDQDRDALFPALAHGYPEELLARLPDVRRCADNAIAAALRCHQMQVVRGTIDATGALVVPLVTSDGCAGVLALEFANGAEQQDLVHALATIITAQLSTLFAATPHAIEDEWARQDQSLVAS